MKSSIYALVVGGLVYSMTLSPNAWGDSSDSQNTMPELVVEEGASQTGTVEEGYRIGETTFGVASLNGLSNLDTPFSVRSYSQDLILNQNFDNIQDLSRADASVNPAFSSVGYYPALSIRGFSLNNWSNYRYNGLVIVNQAQTALESKERIEILKGLSGIQAGFSAPGGIVNYVTKRPTEDALTQFNLWYNEFNDQLYHADISRRSDDGRFGVRFNLAAQAVDSYIRGSEGERYFGSVASDFQFTPATRLTLDAEFQKRRQPVQTSLQPFSDGTLPRGVDRKTALFQPWTNYDTQTSTVAGKLEHVLNSSWTLAVEGNVMELDRDDVSNFIQDPIAPNGDVDLYAYISPDEERRVFNTRTSLNGRFDTGVINHNLTVGISTYNQRNQWGDGYYDVVGQTNIYNPQRFDYPSASVPPSGVTGRLEEQGLFVSDVLSFSDALSIHAGGRQAWVDYDYFSLGEKTGQYRDNIFIPSFAVVYKPLDNVSTYVSYTRGLEQGGEAPTGTLNQRQQLSPLTSDQFEVGSKAEFAQLSLEGALFHIDRAAEFTNSENYYVQDGEQVHRGIELSATGKITNEITVVTSGLLMDAELKETGDRALNGNRPVAVPEFRLATILEYAPSFLPEGTAFTGSWAHTGSQYVNDVNTIKAGSYDVFGLGARYATKFQGTNVILRMNVENLGDTFYWDNVSYGSLNPGAPRTVWTSFSVRF